MEGVIKPELARCLRTLCLPAFGANHAAHAAMAAAEGWSYDRYLLALCELELGQRERRRKERMLLASKLPRSKTLESFDRTRLKTGVNRQISALQEGEFLDRAENVLVFGPPGGGKTHLLSGLGHALVERGRTVLFASCVLLVQRLLLAKTELKLAKELKALDRYEALIIDDIGYVQQDRDEMEVLFTLLAHRYEQRSVLLTSNLVFSEWERIFKDPMTTAAAIDRLVHHSVILELNLPSYRMETAKGRKAKPAPSPTAAAAKTLVGEADDAL